MLTAPLPSPLAKKTSPVPPVPQKAEGQWETRVKNKNISIISDYLFSGLISAPDSSHSPKPWEKGSSSRKLAPPHPAPPHPPTTPPSCLLTFSGVPQGYSYKWSHIPYTRLES